MNNDLIAHSQNENKTNEAQPLSEHALNVSAYMQNMLEPIGLGNLGAFIGLMHDIGKADERWQEWIRGESTEHPTHSHYGRIIYNQEIFPDQETTGTIVDDFRFIVANVILGHHSNLYDAIGLNETKIRINGQESNFRSLEQVLTQQAAENAGGDQVVLDAFLGHAELTSEDLIERYRIALHEFAQWAVRSHDHFEQTCPNEVDQRYGFYKTFLQMLLLSSLNDADTLDTQRHHDVLPFSIPEMPDWSPYSADVESMNATFEPKYEIDHIRSEISEACKEDAAILERVPSVKRLSVFTGGGKTLCSARYAFNYALANHKSKVFYVIPFTTIIDQTAEVFDGFLNADAKVLVHHSNAVGSSGKGKENKASVIDYSEDVILTTQVRFLDGVFSDERRSNKLFCKYINSVVIFDEFQSVPEKIIDMFYVLVDFMSQTMRCNVILCSATQLESLNVKLDVELLSGVDWEERYRDKLRRTEYIEHISYDKEAVRAEDIVSDAASREESSLVITNTKKQAEELFIALDIQYADDDNVDVFYLSTNMHMNHRQKTLSEIKESLACEKVTILVSTSLIEAGVDISFENCIRYENGLDHVIQSGGRCNRNGELPIGHVYIISEPDDLRSKGYRDQQQALRCAIAQEEGRSIEGALSRYYREYLDRLGDMTKYETPYGKLFDLLSDNKPFLEQEEFCKMMGMDYCLPSNATAIRTARSLFHTIGDKEQISVFIAIDGDAQLLLESFENATTYRELRAIQRDMQPYTVTVYSNQQDLIHQLDQLENQHLDVSVIFTNSDFLYSEKFGLSTSALGSSDCLVL